MKLTWAESFHVFFPCHSSSMISTGTCSLTHIFFFLQVKTWTYRLMNRLRIASAPLVARRIGYVESQYLTQVVTVMRFVHQLGITLTATINHWLAVTQLLIQLNRFCQWDLKTTQIITYSRTLLTLNHDLQFIYRSQRCISKCIFTWLFCRHHYIYGHCNCIWKLLPQ